MNLGLCIGVLKVLANVIISRNEHTLDEKRDCVVVHEISLTDERVDGEFGIFVVIHDSSVSDAHFQDRQIIFVLQTT